MLTNASTPLFAQGLIDLIDPTTLTIGVGDSSAAESIEHTDLQGTNTFKQVVDQTSIEVINNVIHCQATFSGDDANFDWLEWGIFAGNTMIQRKVSNQGTKRSGQTWILEAQLTIGVKP